jgi:hypothetical protein
MGRRYHKRCVQAFSDLTSSYLVEGPAQVDTEFTCVQTYVRIGSPAEILTQTHWKLIGRSMTAPPPVLSPSSILLPPTSHSNIIPAWKNSVRIQKTPLFQLLYIFKIA